MDNTRKNFTVDEKNYYVKLPKEYVIRQAEAKQSIVFTECISKGVLTKKKTKDLLKEKGIWDESKEAQEKEIVEEINLLTVELSNGNGAKKVSIKEGKEKALRIRDLREKYLELITERQSYESNTAEAIADNARFDYFVYACTYDENDRKVFSSYEDYQERSSDPLAYSAATNLASLLYALDDDFSSKLPENIFLRRFRIIDKDGRFIDKDGNYIDKDGRKLNELGHYINDEGKRVDKNGNLLDENGNYVMSVTYVDEDGNEIIPLD
jgi:hypothetical protein